MQQKRDLEAWADSVLDPHRTSSARGPVPMRHRRRAWLDGVEALVTIVGVVLLLAFAISVMETF